MNERMVELFAQAGISDSINEAFGIEYLAELIVKETVSCMHYHMGDKPIWEAEKAVYEHFGVN